MNREAAVELEEVAAVVIRIRTWARKRGYARVADWADCLRVVVANERELSDVLAGANRRRAKPLARAG